MFLPYVSVSCAFIIALTFVRREAIEAIAYALPWALYRAFRGLAQEGLEFGEELFDRVEV